MKIHLVNIDELCTEVNRVLEARGISVPDGRTASVVTPRNVRYYRTIGLMQPPSRRGGRAEYQQEHLEEIIEIKKAQHDGISLEQLLKLRQREWNIRPDNDFRVSLRTTDVSEESIFRSLLSPSLASMSKVEYSEVELPFGWSINIGRVMLSGSGEQPTRQQISAIRKVLEIDD